MCQMKKLLLITYLTFLSSACIAQSLQEVFNAGNKAYEANNYPDFLYQMQKADSMRPNHPVILRNLGAAYSLNLKKYEAVQVLERVAYMNANIDLDNPDFINLQDLEPFEKLKNTIASLKNEVRNSTKAFTLDDKNLHPEGIEYYAKQNVFYVGSIRKKKIIKVDEKGNCKDFAQSKDYLAIMGLAIDNDKDLLWACTTAAPEMEGYTDTLEGNAEILCFDLKNEKLLDRYPVKGQKAWLGDLAISPTGEVYASSSLAEHPALFKVNKEKGITEEWLSLESLISLQGLTFNKSGELLYLADYRHGIFSINMENKQITKIQNSTPHPLKGIDGLYFYQQHLIAICNGLQPFQVVQFTLGEEQTISSFKYLDKALPEMGEPTLGTFNKNKFFYVANSPWGAYDENKNLLPDKVQKGIILKLTL